MKTLIIGIIFLSAISCQHNPKRTIASADKPKPKLDINSEQIKVLTEMLQLNNKINTKKLKISTEIKTDQKNKDFFNDAKKAISKAIGITLVKYQKLSEKGETANLTELLKKNLFSEFLSAYVFTLEFYQLVNGKISFNIYLIPEDKQMDNFNNEYNSNNLIDLSQRHDFTSEMNDKFSPINKIKNPKHPLPDKDNYLGGIVSIDVNFLNIGIPSKKQIFNGHIRYRRFYSLKEKQYNLDLKINNRVINNASINGPEVLTVDVYKTFSLGAFTPKLTRVDYAFGNIIDHSGTPKDGSLALKFDNNKVAYEISNLSFDFNDNKFSLKNSKIKSYLAHVDWRKGRHRPVARKQRYYIKKLLSNQENLIKNLNLIKYWGEFE